MSRGRGRVQRMILESVNGTRYGCTVRQLAYLVYGTGQRGPLVEPPTEAQLETVERTVRRLLDEERVVERVMFGHDRYLLPATAPVPRPTPRRRPAGVDVTRRLTLQCLDCDLRWVSEEYAPHRLCWSCGTPGTPVRARARRTAAPAL